jgi:hypothetical protein
MWMPAERCARQQPAKLDRRILGSCIADRRIGKVTEGAQNRATPFYSVINSKSFEILLI